MTDTLTFPSGDGVCAATLYRPANGGGTTCIVLANGVSMTRRDGVPRFAERFAAEGYTAVTFDPRHLGESPGEPRGLIDPDRHRADLRAALSFARSLDGVERVVLWGYSLGGGLALEAAATDRDLAATVLLCPMLDGLAYTLAAPMRNNLRITAAAVRGLVRREAPAMPVIGAPDAMRLFTQAEAAPGFAAVVGEGSLWRNEVCLVPTQPIPRFRPVRHARQVTSPLLLCLGTNDGIVPIKAIEKAAATAPHAELRRYPVDHFSGFTDGFEPIVRDQLEFLG